MHLHCNRTVRRVENILKDMSDYRSDMKWHEQVQFDSYNEYVVKRNSPNEDALGQLRRTWQGRSWMIQSNKKVRYKHCKLIITAGSRIPTFPGTQRHSKRDGRQTQRNNRTNQTATAGHPNQSGPPPVNRTRLKSHSGFEPRAVFYLSIKTAYLHIWN